MNARAQRLNAIFLEDSLHDIDLVHQSMKDHFGDEAILDSASTAQEFLRLIETGDYDVLLADHKPPEFDAFEVLRHAVCLCPQTPFICISGSMGEDNAVELVKQGAADYVRKDRLERLGLAIPRALEMVAANASKTQSDREMLKAKEQLVEVQRIAHIGSWEWDLETNQVACSREVYTIHGLDPDLHKGITVQYVHDEDRQKNLDAQDAAIRGITPFYEVEYPLRRPDGTIIYITSRGIVKRDKRGNAVSMLGFVQDITDRKQIELALQKTKENLQEAQSIAHIGSWDWDITAGQLWWSDESYRLLGANPSSESVVELHIERMDEQERERVAKICNLALKNREPFDATYRILSLDGKTKYIRSLGRAQYNEEGQPVYLSGTMQDVTEQMMTEMEIKKIRHNLEEAQRIARLGSWEVDPRTGDVFWSAEAYRITGIDPLRTKVRRGITYDYMDDGDRQRLHHAMEAAANEHKPFDLEYPFHRADGTTIYANTRGSVQFGPDGEPLILTGTIQDITDHRQGHIKALEDEKKRIDAEARMGVLTEFFTNVSHELKTPLSLILMQIDSMRLNLCDEKRMLKLLDDSSLNAYRLTRLVNNLLDIVKIDSGFMKLNLRKRDVVNAVKNICDSVSSYAAAKSIAIDFISDVKMKEMDLDLEKLDRVLLNLLSNAIKYTPSQGRILVKIKDLKNKILLFVQDTGEGIPNEKLKSIFDRFVQVSNRMSRQAEGCGIGLALVKSIVEMHGGKIWVKSEVGRGSEFVVELPSTVSEASGKPDIIEGFELTKKVRMELSDLYVVMK